MANPIPMITSQAMMAYKDSIRLSFVNLFIQQSTQLAIAIIGIKNLTLPLGRLRKRFELELLFDSLDAFEEVVDGGWCRPLGDHVVGIGHCSADCIELLVHPGQAVVDPILMILKGFVDRPGHTGFKRLNIPARGQMGRGPFKGGIKLFLRQGHMVKISVFKIAQIVRAVKVWLWRFCGKRVGCRQLKPNGEGGLGPPG
ncbi:MAG: hypothetical protein KF886_10220 [Candidatus Hydrogenedentes bacterium]|nr:hypothetical protein [Candidatus Hydrogenedentota bacterium]